MPPAVSAVERLTRLLHEAERRRDGLLAGLRAEEQEIATLQLERDAVHVACETQRAVREELTGGDAIAPRCDVDGCRSTSVGSLISGREIVGRVCEEHWFAGERNFVRRPQSQSAHAGGDALARAIVEDAEASRGGAS